MELVSENVQLPKGLAAVKDLLVDIVAKLHQGMSLSMIGATEFPKLEALIASIGELPEDVKCAQMPVLAGLMAGQLAAALLAPIPVKAAVEPPPSVL